MQPPETTSRPIVIHAFHVDIPFPACFVRYGYSKDVMRRLVSLTFAHPIMQEKICFHASYAYTLVLHLVYLKVNIRSRRHRGEGIFRHLLRNSQRSWVHTLLCLASEVGVDSSRSLSDPVRRTLFWRHFRGHWTMTSLVLKPCFNQDVSLLFKLCVLQVKGCKISVAPVSVAQCFWHCGLLHVACLSITPCCLEAFAFAVRIRWWWSKTSWPARYCKMTPSQTGCIRNKEFKQILDCNTATTSDWIYWQR